MDAFAALRTLLAVRSYQAKPVPDAVVRRILEAGRVTRSGMNPQPWHFIVVRDGETLRSLGGLASSGPYVAPAGRGRSIQLSPSSSLANTSPPLVAQNMRRGCRASNASANMVVFGSTPIFIRLQLAPPSLLRKSAPTSLWKFEPAATQMVLGSPGTSRMSRQ